MPIPLFGPSKSELYSIDYGTEIMRGKGDKLRILHDFF